MTDNFKQFKEFIQSQSNGEFDHDEDSFYMAEIIGRSKDDAKVKSHKFKTYYIKKLEDLDKYESEIKTICDTLQMRAYISVNSKSMKQATLDTMAEYAIRISHGEYTKPYSVFDSCAAKYTNKSNHLWIIDVDKEDYHDVDELAKWYSDCIIKCRPNKPVVQIFNTRSGKHIVCHPFDIKQFLELTNLPSIEGVIKKNNSTLLYENIK